MHLLTWTVPSQDGERWNIRLQRDAGATKYAILSHRWGHPDDEVSYQDITAGHPEQKRRYEKLLGCCRQAQNDGLHYVWMDTCCFDKSSSAELSEVITSMYTYYEQSTLCYAFLDDVFIDSTANEELISFLDPEFIPDSILVPSQTAFTTSYPQTLLDLVDIRKRLIEQSLIKRDHKPGGIQIRRLVQSIVNERMDPGESQRALKTAIWLVHSAWINAGSDREDNGADVKSRNYILTHIFRLQEFATQLKNLEDDDSTRRKLSELLSFAREYRTL